MSEAAVIEGMLSAKDKVLLSADWLADLQEGAVSETPAPPSVLLVEGGAEVSSPAATAAEGIHGCAVPQRLVRMHSESAQSSSARLSLGEQWSTALGCTMARGRKFPPQRLLSGRARLVRIQSLLRLLSAPLVATTFAELLARRFPCSGMPRGNGLDLLEHPDFGPFYHLVFLVKIGTTQMPDISAGPSGKTVIKALAQRYLVLDGAWALCDVLGRASGKLEWWGTFYEAVVGKATRDHTGCRIAAHFCNGGGTEREDPFRRSQGSSAPCALLSKTQLF
ncbi:hypothetical protein Efla_000740 [Eimeria flavescens]